MLLKPRVQAPFQGSNNAASSYQVTHYVLSPTSLLFHLWLIQVLISWKVSKFLSVYHDKFKHENATLGGNLPHKVPSLTRSQILSIFCGWNARYFAWPKPHWRSEKHYFASKFQKILSQKAYFRKTMPEVRWN